MSPLPSTPPTFAFACQRCGACCRWEGDVCLTEEDIAAIADFLGLSEVDFINSYCRVQRNRQGLSLIDAEGGACVMLEEGGCRIQPVKPRQCRDFPLRWNFPGWEKRCPGFGQTDSSPALPAAPC